MSTLDSQINTGEMMATLIITHSNNNSTYNYWGYSGSYIAHIFARFTGVSIPAGATVDVAYVSLKSAGIYTGAMEGTRSLI